MLTPSSGRNKWGEGKLETEWHVEQSMQLHLQTTCLKIKASWRSALTCL